jgi:predicted PurR-regulated permease PerM
MSPWNLRDGGTFGSIKKISSMRRQNIDTLSGLSSLRVVPLVVYAGVILYFGRNLFIPISFALLISFILYPICRWLESKGFSRVLAIAVSLSLLVILGVLLVALLASQFISFLDEWPLLQAKFDRSISEVSKTLADVFSISKDQQKQWVAKIMEQSGSNLLAVLKNAISASAFSTVLLVLIPVYAALLLYYRQYWMKVLGRIFPHERSESLRSMIALSIGAYYNFVKGMAVVYLVVGSLNSIGLLLLGIPHAILFGFIASILTIVPYVGIIAGSLLPMAMAWITYDSIWYPIGIAGIFTFVQYLEANVIFPIAVSSRLNVNTLVMLVVIFAGGILWGVAGMILFVPFVGIAKLVADHNPKWKTISMVLGMESNERKRAKP